MSTTPSRGLRLGADEPVTHLGPDRDVRALLLPRPPRGEEVIVGHYAAALVPYSKLDRRAPLWLLMLCAQVPEFLWLVLSLAGVEKPSPDSMLDATFGNVKVEMLYSHNLVPALLQALVVSAIVFAVWRRR